MTMNIYPEETYTEEDLARNGVPTHKEYEAQLNSCQTGADKLQARQAYAEHYSDFVRRCIDGTVVGGSEANTLKAKPQ